MSLTSMYPMKKKRKRTTDKTPVRRTRRNWDADISPMATSMLGTPSPNNSSIDTDKDIIWDNCSPTQYLPMRLRNQGRPEVTDIAQLIKVVPAENAINVEQNFQPLLGLWMEHGHDLLTENLKSSTNQRKVKGRKTRSKIGHLRSDVFSSELCKLAKMMEGKEDSPVATEKLKLRSNKVYESPLASRITSTPSQEEKQINFKNKRKSSLNGSNELWGQDEWFEDESFLQQATQIENDVCSQIYTGKQTNSTMETKQTQPKTYSCQPSLKTPVTRKTRRGKNAFNDESKLLKTKDIFEAGKVNKTEIKLNYIIPTLPLKPRQLHGTFQNTLRIKSEEIDLKPKVEVDEEVWDDLDDNELAGLECELDTNSPLANKTECQRSGRAALSRKCFRFKTNTSVENVNTGVTNSDDGGNLNKQLAFQKLCSPVTRSMTRDRNNRIGTQDTVFSNGFANTNMDNNNTQCSQEQIEKKRLLAIQRRQQRKQNVSSSTKRIGNSKQIR